MKMPDDASGAKTGGETRQTFQKHTPDGHVLKIASNYKYQDYHHNNILIQINTTYYY